MTEHWVDRLSQELARHTSRRQSLRLGALLASGLALSSAADGAAANKPKKKNQNKKGKDKGKPGKGKKPTPPPPPPPPSQGGDTPDDHNNCRPCATPCGEGELCVCGACVCATPGLCCPPGNTPCSGDCCPDLPSWACCPDSCKFIAEDRNNCGGCGVICPPGQFCIDRECRCADGYKYCPLAERCFEEDYICCGNGNSRGTGGGACGPGLMCCGSGDSAQCKYSWDTC
jgi:hypothetical protein